MVEGGQGQQPRVLAGGGQYSLPKGAHDHRGAVRPVKCIVCGAASTGKLSGVKGSVWASDSLQSVCTAMDVMDSDLVSHFKFVPLFEYFSSSSTSMFLASHLLTLEQLSLLARNSVVKSSGTWLTSGAYLVVE